MITLKSDKLSVSKKITVKKIVSRNLTCFTCCLIAQKNLLKNKILEKGTKFDSHKKSWLTMKECDIKYFKIFDTSALEMHNHIRFVYETQISRI